MQNFKCHVTGSTSKTFPGKAKPPVYCADDPTKCVKGPKQMIVWHRKSTSPRPSPHSPLFIFEPRVLLFTSLQNHTAKPPPTQPIHNYNLTQSNLEDKILTTNSP